MNFNRKIVDNVKENGVPFIVAHRGVYGANIPCNSLASYQIAVAQGADVVELDVTKSKDGEVFAFHPGTEPIFLNCGKSIPEMTTEEVKQVPLLNLDKTPTHYRVPTLKEALLSLKDKAYVNVDKFWTDPQGIAQVIRDCGMEKQVIVKAWFSQEVVSVLEKYAPNLMYMAIVRGQDTVTERLLQSKINYIGTEVLFTTADEEVASKAYVDAMHEKGLIVWANSIIYDERDVIAANFTDDNALINGADGAWGELVKRGYDFIQTDWTPILKGYLNGSKKA